MKNILDKVTYHAVYDDSIVDALRYAKANGFAGIQVAAEAPHLSFEALTAKQRDTIASFRRKHALSISLHAPDNLTSLFAASEILSRGISRYFQGLFDFAEEIGAGLITMHPGSMTRFRTDENPARRIPEADRAIYAQALSINLLRLVELARRRFVICIEYCQVSLGLQKRLQPFLDSGELSLCWDLAKTFDGRMRCNVELEQYFWRRLQHVRQVHLHDIRGGRCHRAIGTGHINFMDFLPRLAEADVAEYCIEVRPREKATQSLANLRQLIETAGASLPPGAG